MKKNDLTLEEIEDWAKRIQPVWQKDKILKNGICKVVQVIDSHEGVEDVEEIIRKLLAEGAEVGVEALDYICDQLPKNCIELLVDEYLKNKDENDTR
jgi:hypothetical protein